MDQERRRQKDNEKCQGNETRLTATKNRKKKEIELCCNIKLFFPRRDRESREHKHGEKGNTDAEREGSGKDNGTDGRRQEKESLSAIGSQAEAQNSPVINTLMSSLSSGTLGAGRAHVSGSAHLLGRAVE